MDENKVWAYSSTGTRMHAFVQTSRLGYRRAMCRSNIERPDTAIFVVKEDAHLLCPSCANRFADLVNRVEASMMPATESQDLGYVHPVVDREPEIEPAAAPPGVDMDALHAQALEMDAEETARAACPLYRVVAVVAGDGAPAWSPTIVSGVVRAPGEFTAQLDFRRRYESGNPDHRLVSLSASRIWI